MKKISPNVVIVLGSESALIKPIVAHLARDKKVIRVYSRTVPEPRENCVDVSNINAIPKIIDKLLCDGEVRIGFIGAAFKRQQNLLINLENDEINDMIDTNITLYIQAMKLILPLMIRTKFGRIVYLSSFRSEQPVRGASIYSASKAFGEVFFSAIGKEYGRFGISTVSIRMGYFDSGMIEDFKEDLKREVKKLISTNRFGDSKDLESVINFCFTETYLNSGVVDLNGGLSLG